MFAMEEIALIGTAVDLPYTTPPIWATPDHTYLLIY